VTRTLAALSFLLALATPAAADVGDWLDRADRALTVASRDGSLRAQLSGLLDVEGYWIDQRPPGLIFGDGDSFVNPRLSLFLDAHAGRHVYGFVQARFDRGFDPRERDGAARLDEFLVRWTPFDDASVNVQAGKFATVVGNWAARDDSWTNPFVDAPLPYENVTIVSDSSVASTPAELLRRRGLPDRKRLWVPVVWGPSYAAGAAVFGRVGRLDYAAEVKNAALSMRPAYWNPLERDWSDPTASARLGWRPAVPWTLGVSFSSGPYLADEARRNLPPGRGIGDFRQTVVAGDATFAWRHLAVWAEFFACRFDVPIRRGPDENADTAAWYAEARYKITPAWFAALRWNQQVFGDVPDGHGGRHPWDRDVWRADTAVGWRLGRHVQAKVQYAFARQAGELQQGQQLVAMQLTLRF
jgi:hypothetical protein